MLLVIAATLMALNGGLGVYRLAQGENAVGQFLSAAGMLLLVIAVLFINRSDTRNDDASRRDGVT